MAESSSTAPEAAERSSSPAPEPITFTVKAANDAKYPISLHPTATIAELKEKLHQLSDIPIDRQRLIYSGRVMKNDETIGFYKVKSGNTVHMVKGAVSSTNSGAAATASGASGSAGVPRNLAAGSGNNPLAGLTGARYAGHVQLPSVDMFGPDGGMGVAPDPETIAQTMSNPMFQAQMNEMLQNPQLLDYIISTNPILQSMGPEARQLMQSDMFRQMMTNPYLIRQMSRMSQNMGGSSPMFPEPGVTDTTPGQGGQQSTSTQSQSQDHQQQSPMPVNPFASMLGSFNPGTGQPSSGSLPSSSGGEANPFTNPLSMQALLQSMGGVPSQPASGQGHPAASPSGGQPQVNPTTNPAVVQALVQALSAAPLPTGGTSITPGNPFAGLFGGMPPSAMQASTPPDNRPPEERYAEQLRQLNDMGFFDFERNVEALRRSGGSVQGAVNQLLGDL